MTSKRSNGNNTRTRKAKCGCTPTEFCESHKRALLSLNIAEVVDMLRDLRDEPPITRNIK